MINPTDFTSFNSLDDFNPINRQVMDSILDDIDLIPYYEIVDLLADSGITMKEFKRYYAINFN